MTAVVVGLLATSCLHNVTIDFDGDSRSDIAWYSVTSTTTSWIRIPPQDSTDLGTVWVTAPNEEIFRSDTRMRPVPADYDGNGKPEVANVDANGNWITEGAMGAIAFPAPPLAHSGNFYSMIPVPGRYLTAGKAVPAWYDDSSATWYVDGGGPVQFGTGPTSLQHYPPFLDDIDQDIPVPADYDGDRLDDLAVYNPLTGRWRIRYSRDQSERTVVLGGIHEAPAPADYDGDHKADVAVYTYLGTGTHTFTIEGQPGGGVWTQSFTQMVNEQDLPAVADYDGDGKADMAAFDSNTGTEVGMNGVLQLKYSSNGETFRLSGGTPFVGIPLAIPPALIVNIWRTNLLYANYCYPNHPPTC